MFVRYPLLWALVALASGILTAGFSSVMLWQAIVLVCACVAALFIALKKSVQFRPMLWFLLFFGFGFTNTVWQNQSYSQHHFSHFNIEKQRYAARVLSTPVPTKKAIRLEIDLKRSFTSAQPISGKVILYTPKSPQIMQTLPGDFVVFDAVLSPISPPQNPHEFDYRNYLHLHQIFAQSYVEKIMVAQNDDWHWQRSVAKMRGKLLQQIDAMPLNSEQKSIASALLLGYRFLISDQTQQAFAGAGAMHVLAVSGLHVGILYLITAFLLRIDKQKQHRNNWEKVILTIAIIWFYAAITGLSPSVSRAAVMFTFMAIGHLFKRKPATYQALIASAIFLLVIAPNNLFQVGFQLSYAAVFGILFIQPKIYGLIKEPRFWLPKQIWAITSVSIAAQAATFPFGLYYFHQFPLLFLVSNLIVIPLAWLLMMYGMFLLLLGIFIAVPAWLILPFKWLLMFMIKSVSAVEALPHSVLLGISISRWELVAIFTLVMSTVLVIWQRKKLAFWLVTFCLLALCTANTWEAWQENHREKLTFYSIKKTAAVEVVAGKKALFVAPQSFLKNEDAQLFHVRHNQWAAGIDQPASLGWSEDTSLVGIQKIGPYIKVKNRIIAYLENERACANLPPKISFALVKSGVYPQENMPQKVHYILENGHSIKSKEAWEKTHLQVYNLAENGALEIDLSED